MWPFSRKTQDVQVVVKSNDAHAFHLPAKVPAKHQTQADALDYYCKKHGATYERTRLAADKVRIRVTMPSGDVLGGNGPTTADAVAEVIRKMEAAQ